MKILKNYGLIYALFVILTIFTIYQVYFPFLVTYEEPHYISVSWFMWHSKNWMVLHDTGGVYINKPPLLFWIVNLFWHWFGIHTWVFRAIPCLATFGIIIILPQIFIELWPIYSVWRTVPLFFFIGTWYILHYIPLFLMDMVLLFFITLTLWGLVRAFSHKKLGWVTFTLGNILGLFTKGPVTLIFTLIPALLAIFFIDSAKKNKKSWLFKLFLNLLVSLGTVAIWVIALFKHIDWNLHGAFFIQRVLATNHTYGHRPWWFYLIKLPLILLPWSLWPQLYGSLYRKLRNFKQYREFQWLVASTIVIFVVMSLFSAKTSRYLMPISIYFSLIFSYSLLESLKTPYQNYRNFPLLFLILFISLLLIFSPFFIRNAISSISFYLSSNHSVILGFLLLLMVITLIYQKEKWHSANYNLIKSVSIQSFLMFFLLILYTLGPQKESSPQIAIARFQNCVFRHLKGNVALAYQYRYGGYWFNVNDRMLPTALVLRNGPLVQWVSHHPHSIVILDGRSGFPNAERLCLLKNKENKIFLTAIKIG